MLKINRLSGSEGKTGLETAGPVNRAVMQCLHITALMAHAHKFCYRRRIFHFIILHAKAKETSAGTFSKTFMSDQCIMGQRRMC